MKLFELSYCSECGEARIPHFPTKFQHIFSDTLMSVPPLRFLSKVLEDIADTVIASPTARRALMRTAYGLTNIGAGSLTDAPQEGESTRTLALYEGADASGVRLLQFKLFGALPLYFIAEKEVNGKQQSVVFAVIPRPQGFISPSLAWMDDKGKLKTHFEKNNVPTAKGGVAANEEEAVALFRTIGGSVIAKPLSGSRGRHTTLDMRTEEEVRRGFRIAYQINTKVIIEKYLHGTVHRVTLVGGKPVAVARREYPHMIGDGEHTVDQLVDIENQNPARDGVFFRAIDKKHRAEDMLKKQSLSWESVPEKGRKVILNDKNSRLHGTVTEDVTDIVHPQNMQLFERIGTVLGDPIVGVDFMIDDMAIPWTDQPDSGVLECNSMPFIDVHHKVVSGRTINVAKYLWDEIFK